MEPDVALRESIEQAASAILAKAEEDPSLSGMGTTCVLAMVQNGYLFGAHIGDSRMYLLRDGILHRMTRDHTAVQRLVEAGILTKEEAATHPKGNVLSRVLGSEFSLYVEVLAPPWELEEGDRILLCSDGLYGEVSDDEIQSILEQQKPVQEIVEDMIQAANDNGGRDNVTVQIMIYGKAPPSSEAPTQIQPTIQLQPEEPWQAVSKTPEIFLFYILLFLTPFFLGYFAGNFTNPQNQHSVHPTLNTKPHKNTKLHNAPLSTPHTAPSTQPHKTLPSTPRTTPNIKPHKSPPSPPQTRIPPKNTHPTTHPKEPSTGTINQRSVPEASPANIQEPPRKPLLAQPKTRNTINTKTSTAHKQTTSKPIQRSKTNLNIAPKVAPQPTTQPIPPT
ncbi:MAG: protein phosphatase 2C domain-containing protein, partial [Myxococcota bacterium]